jgi:PAS domain S-box-containing protein
MHVSSKPTAPFEGNNNQVNTTMETISDLATKQRMQEQLDPNEQHYRQLIDLCQDGIFLTSQGRITHVNRAGLELIGSAGSDCVRGHSLSEFLPAALPATPRQPKQPIDAGASAASNEFKLQRLDGGMIDVAVITAPYQESNEAGLMVMVHDLAKPGRAATPMDVSERQREQERQLRLIIDAVPVFIAQCDKNYRLRFVNKPYAERFGLRPEDVVGRRIPDVIGEEAFSLVRKYVDAALAGKTQEHELKIPFRGIGDRTVHMVCVPERDDRDQVHGLIAAISDITRLRHTEEKLHRREQDFKTLVENSPDGISRIDRNKRHIYVNPAVGAVSGLQAEDYLGKTKAELGLPPDLVHAWDTATDAAFETGVEQRFEFELTGSGRTGYFSACVIPESDRDGHIESVLGITYDVTERTKMEKEHELLLARERTARIFAETAARARDEFLAIVSHELRAPLNGIQSWAHVLENYVKDAAATPLAQRALTGIKTGVAQQVRLIEDLLDVTCMMSGKLRLVKQPFALLPVIQAAVESVRTIAAAKHIGITCTYQITTEQIDGDTDRMQQIVWNLLSNAVKFTPPDGNVWLNAAARDSHVVITVHDDGVGISPDFLPHLFDRFSQEDTSSTRGHSGLGLGLFLVKHLIELHGGSVKAESPGEGRGTTFSFTLPLRTHREKYVPATHAGEASGTANALPSLAGLHILLIDDQEEARESLAFVLGNAGANVFSAASSMEVFDWLAGAGLNKLPDILVCDIAMPVEDGYAVLRKIRGWKSTEGLAPLHRLPALALTAFAQREDRIRALTAGFQMHMAKPVAPEELIVVIAMMASRG